ncbi:hypothetical protein Lpl7_1068 [Lacticaseibacillus paracasei subsp. tolerans Lpl7]|uniref:Uncharacterized protein n=1 Tax=Lacticaseibacillus paracasei subsp. paracasei Lpp225 TaxID=1256225 RepID=S2N8G6_LACPA|nr:hypothetical protein Lpl7_1068 [Lacticaseibacillus paracasei subsp. tolerans Lpl7]EPC37062.1 hypothetical protein Lpp225_2086 [Lacticaseibacillus paracasei subsp. paracasei Lpp225]OUC66554.1 hypothetical protein BLL69_2340c [Lacticaseibacillus paracasei]
MTWPKVIPEVAFDKKVIRFFKNDQGRLLLFSGNYRVI